MGKPKAPKAPDPKETASAQTSTNVGTAIANSYLGNVNQVTPDGSLTYTQTGTKKWTDPLSGKVYDIPITTATQTLSQQQQAIKDQSDKADLNLATLGNNLSGTLGQQLTGNFKLGNEATEARLFELGRTRLDPKFAQDEESLRTKLLNSGIRQGSPAWSAAMNDFNQGKNDAYNSLLLSGRGQAAQELLTEDNQRINQISALLNGGQVSQPNFVNTQGQTMPTVDYAGIVNQDYQNRLGAYNQQQQMAGGILGGLFGLGKAAIAASDERVKTDIEKVGELKGHNLYEWTYKGEFDDGKRHTGVMAQEVEKKRPDAVMTGPDGVKRVHYGKLFELGKAA